MIQINETQLKELIDDLIMVEDDIYVMLNKEPKKCDMLNNSGYMLGRIIRVLSQLDNQIKV